MQRSCARLLLDLPAKLELGLLGQRDVGADPDEADQLAVRPEARLRDGAQPAIFAVVAQVAPLEREGRWSEASPAMLFGDDPLDVVGMDPASASRASERPRDRRRVPATNST